MIKILTEHFRAPFRRGRLILLATFCLGLTLLREEQLVTMTLIQLFHRISPRN